MTLSVLSNPPLRTDSHQHDALLSYEFCLYLYCCCSTYFDTFFAMCPTLPHESSCLPTVGHDLSSFDFRHNFRHSNLSATTILFNKYWFLKVSSHWLSSRRNFSTKKKIPQLQDLFFFSSTLRVSISMVSESLMSDFFGIG